MKTPSNCVRGRERMNEGDMQMNRRIDKQMDRQGDRERQRKRKSHVQG